MKTSLSTLDFIIIGCLSLVVAIGTHFVLIYKLEASGDSETLKPTIKNPLG